MSSDYLYDDYVAYARRYKSAYGETTTVVAYEVGKFLNWYNCDQGLGCDVIGICECINVAVTRRNKNIPEITKKNPMMGGVPRDAFFNKYLKILIDNDYTVIVVSQLQQQHSGGVVRGVTHVISKGVGADESNPQYLSAGASNDNPHHNCVVAIYSVLSKASAGPQTNRNIVDLGVSAIDLSTGHSWAYEVNSSCTDPNFAHDELVRLIQEHNPQEIAVYGRPAAFAAMLGLGVPSTEKRIATEAGGDVECNYKPSDLIDAISCDFGLNPRIVRSRLSDSEEVLDTIEKVKFQEHALRTVFPQTGFLSALEMLDLEQRPHAAASYVGLLQFIFEHNEHVVKDLPRPSVYTCDEESDATLQLTYNAAEQLDIIAPGGGGGGGSGGAGAVGGKAKGIGGGVAADRGTLLGALECCTTSMGRRMFKRRLLHPSCDVTEINRRLDQVERRLQDAEEIRKHLSVVRDLDRLFRRLALRRLEPIEFDLIVSSMAAVWEASTLGAINDLRDGAETIRHAICSQINMEEAKKVVSVMDVRSNMFVEGVYPEIDALQNQIRLQRAFLEQFADRLNAKQGNGYFKIIQDDAQSLLEVVGTSRRCAAMLSALANETVVLSVEGRCMAISISEVKAEHHSGSGSASSTASSRLVHPLLQEWSKDVNASEKSMRKMIKREYDSFLDRLWSSHGAGMLELSTRIAQLDVASACALNAKTMRHFRPKFGNPSCLSTQPSISLDKSTLDAKQLRHPIVELLHKRTPHIPNDVQLGRDDSVGVLLYGINAAGKSCLMKAVGIAIVMAQAGMYVASCELQISVPFRRILTRIWSKDDLVKGHSTFMVEMSELRDIMQRADPRSLVIGDEVCSGTESVSALSIVGASVRHLLSIRTPFIFATHLHELPALLESLKDREAEADRKKHEGLRICHLRVEYDSRLQTLVYDRKLCEGQGPTVYGLEVCRALDMHPDFLDAAHQIRRTLTGISDTLDGRKSRAAKISRYNARVVMGVCGICKKRCTDEMHHIRPQCEADEKGYFDLYHKNVLFNLVGLCNACHDAVHAGKVSVQGYVQTLDGVRLRSFAIKDEEDEDEDLT